MESGLYVVATPIGNFGDISHRAVEILQGVDLIAAEDTRHSQRLLQHFSIATPAVAYHDHSDSRRVDKIIKCLTNKVFLKFDGYVRVMVFNKTFNNISVISWQSVLLVEETGVPEENHRPVTSH